MITASNGYPFNVVNYARYLGITIADNLSWSQHINNTVASVPMGQGEAVAPPLFGKVNKKSDILTVFTPELMWITLKSHPDLPSAPPLFF